MIVEIISGVVALVSVAYTIRIYHELWTWARMCQNVRIAIAYKNKVKMDYPLTEWILWTNLLDRDKDSNGRVVYNMGSTRVAIIKRYAGEWTWRRAIMARVKAHQLARQKPPPNVSSNPTVKTGKWSAHDETPPQNRIKQ